MTGAETAAAYTAVAEHLVIVVGCVVTVIRLGPPVRHPDKTIAWLVWMWAFTGAADSLAWISIALRWPIPLWLYLLVFAALAGAVWWRTLLIRRPHP